MFATRQQIEISLTQPLIHSLCEQHEVIVVNHALCLDLWDGRWMNIHPVPCPYMRNTYHPAVLTTVSWEKITTPWSRTYLLLIGAQPYRNPGADHATAEGAGGSWTTRPICCSSGVNSPGLKQGFVDINVHKYMKRRERALSFLTRKLQGL